jgi:putative restriction endonuclease
MKFFVGVTDNQWFDYLRQLKSRSPEYLDEVNFWQPSSVSIFQVLKQGEIFLFKLHSPYDFIVGGGVFAYSTILPISLAWDAFGVKNGAETFEKMRQLIIHHRHTVNNCQEDFYIGCLLLTQPFFLNKSEWFPVPEWKSPIVRGKRYDLNSEAGKFIWEKLSQIWEKNKIFNLDKEAKRITEEHARYGKETTIKPRLGQGIFRIEVTDAYNRTCAITLERALPVLEASHIKSYADGGPNEVNNGLLLRIDMHKLFDRGYLTVTPKLVIEVSRRIKEEFDNGEYYFAFHGKKIYLPQRFIDQPSPDFLTWHNEKKFKG